MCQVNSVLMPATHASMVSDFVQNWSVFEIGIWRYLLHGFFIYCMLNTTDQGSRVTRPDKFKNSPGSIYARIYTWLSETKNRSLVCCITAMSWFHELVAEFYEWMKTVSWLLPNSTWYDNNRLGFFFFLTIYLDWLIFSVT